MNPTEKANMNPTEKANMNPTEKANMNPTEKAINARIKHHPLSSSIHATLYYDRRLFIWFKDHSVYYYTNVPSSLYYEMARSHSVGCFFNNYIKGKFPEKVIKTSKSPKMTADSLMAHEVLKELTRTRRRQAPPKAKISRLFPKQERVLRIIQAHNPDPVDISTILEDYYRDYRDVLKSGTASQALTTLLKNNYIDRVSRGVYVLKQKGE